MSGPLALVYPVLAQVLLTFVLYVLTARARGAALRARRVRVGEIALSTEPWPDDVKKFSNNLHNQFEAPVLFYVLCGVATYVGATGTLIVVLAWLFVVSRVVHAAIHVTTNRVRYRFYAFAFGLTVLALLWVILVFRLAAV
jgi:hypothetical protein